MHLRDIQPRVDLAIDTPVGSFIQAELGADVSALQVGRAGRDLARDLELNEVQEAFLLATHVNGAATIHDSKHGVIFAWNCQVRIVAVESLRTDDIVELCMRRHKTTLESERARRRLLLHHHVGVDEPDITNDVVMQLLSGFGIGLSIDVGSKRIVHRLVQRLLWRQLRLRCGAVVERYQRARMRRCPPVGIGVLKVEHT